MKLGWLEIERYRNVHPGTRLEFDDGFNVLLGKNGTGKTTLLDLISMLCRGDLTPLQREPFHLRWAGRGRADGEPTTFEVRHDGRDDWAYTIRAEPITLKAGPDGAEISGPDAVDRRSPTSPFSERFPPTVHRGRGRATTFPTAGRGAVRFGEGFDPYHRLKGGGAPPWRMVQLDRVVDERIDRGQESAIELPSAIARASKSLPSGADYAVVDSEDTGWLEALGALFGSKRAECRLRVGRRTARDGNGFARTDFDPPEFTFTFSDGTRLTDPYLSFGQKRMLALAWYFAAVDDIAIVDEVVNGLHHDWIRWVVDALAQRQSFAASQNPLLLDHLPRFESPEAVRRSFVLCTVEGGQFAWRAMRPEQAEDVFASQEVGIQYTSEILRRYDLW